jgi:glucose-1-phosphate adenylyltransferase
VLILAGDHVYKMDYRPMLIHHVNHGADMTVACVEVPIEEANQFGVMSIDATDRVLRFREKPPLPEPAPDNPRRAVVSMGIYVFNSRFLGNVLRIDADSTVSSHDFGRDILPLLIERRANVFAYRFTDSDNVGKGYWRDVGTLSAYWTAHMELLESPPKLTLTGDSWPIHTDNGVQDRPWRRPHSPTTYVTNSLLAHSCDIDNAMVTRSVLSPNVVVGTGSTVSNSVLLPGAVVGRNCRLNNSIVDADCQVPDGAVIDSSRGDNHADRAPAPPPVLVTTEMFSICKTGAAA